MLRAYFAKMYRLILRHVLAPRCSSKYHAHSMSGTVSLPQAKTDPSWKIAIVRSSWHPECTDAMHQDATKELRRLGIPAKNISDIVVPGSFEIPLACQEAIIGKNADGVIALGVIVQGQTHHARLIAEQAAAGIMQVQLMTATPIMFEILFVDRLADARKRAIGKSGKGALAARTLITTLAKLKQLR